MKGVYPTSKKDGTESFRASITFRGKHISLGSYTSMETAAKVYQEAAALIRSEQEPDDYPEDALLPFEKHISLVNFRDNGVYFANPIYLRPRFFRYYLRPEEFLLFDIEELFYYSSHKISFRGGHVFVADYGSQINIKSRYGIRPFAVKDRDYLFCNGDDHDYRFGNIEIVNPYYGVRRITKNEKVCYKALIHVRGDMKIGVYETELEAAIAYNKAADILKKKGVAKQFPINEPECSPKEYSEIYVRVSISEGILRYRSS